ncbi:unnamed protein product, partial [Mesorhabditis spiculigera]
MNLPTKRWEIVHLSKEVAIIDYDVFDRQEAEVLLRNLEADFRDQGLAVDEDPLILPELPPNILGSIMSHLDENSFLEVARSHQNLLEATRLMKNKSFYCVDWQRDKVTFTHREAPSLLRMPWSWTFDEADVLLMGAKVRWMAHDLGARPPNAVGLRVQLLTFCGRDEDARNAAKLAKALDPCEVTIPSRADAHFLTDRMLRYLRNSRHLRNAHLGYIRVDELKHMLEWRIGGLDAILCDPDGRIPTELLTVVQEMHNQWKSGRRALRQVRIEFPYPLPLDPRIAATCMAAGYERLSTSVDTAGTMTSLKLRVPHRNVGLLIGHHGETIRRIGRECGLHKIDIERYACPDAPDFREVTLRGPAAAIELAKPQVIEVTSNRSVGWVTLPADRVPRVIGTNGDTIKGIKARSGAQIDVLTDRPRREGEVSCRIIGSEQAIADAKREIYDVLCMGVTSEEARSPPSPQQQPSIQKTLCNDVKEMATVPGFDFYRQIPVPQDEFGPVIETCGAMLRRIAADANSKITVKENESSCGAARIAHVWSRTEADLETATLAFHQFCKERSRSSQIGTEETLFVEVPNARVGQFVKAIPSIKAVTGAEIRLGGNWDDEGKPYRLFSITGTADEVKQAKEICQKAASDKPYIPTDEQLAQLAIETVELNPWADDAASAMQPRAFLPPWLNDMQPVPLNFRSPSADQYGPQPDDAHKWLEYYRKVGLVDQARVIEALIKARGWKQ